MATVFPQTLGADPAQAGYAVPPELQAQLDAIQRRRMQPVQAAFTPDQVAQRRDENDRQYALGILGGLSSDEGMQGVGGQVLKQALANRQAKISERGTTDPLSGQFQYSPDYLAQRDDQAEAGVQQRIAQGRMQWDTQRQSAAERLDRQREQLASQRETRSMMAGLAASNRPEPVVAVIGPDGVTPTYVTRSNAVGMKPAPSAAAGNASEDEKKASGWFQQATMAYKNMLDARTADPNAAAPTMTEITLQTMSPKHGADAAFARMTPARQRFTTAASSFAEAVLRAATGAGVNENEARQKVQELTPRFGEDQATTAMKQQMAEMYLNSLLTRAGRAAPKGATAPGAGGGNAAPTADPLGLFNR